MGLPGLEGFPGIKVGIEVINYSVLNDLILKYLLAYSLKSGTV